MDCRVVRTNRTERFDREFRSSISHSGYVPRRVDLARYTESDADDVFCPLVHYEILPLTLPRANVKIIWMLIHRLAE
jgi:hypothetical protein